MRTFDGVGDIESSIGSRVGESRWHEVGQGQIDAFAEATGDHQWIHVDRGSAARGPFGTTVAHGFLTLSLVTSLAEEVYTIRGASMIINYGLDRVRFPAPVRCGARVKGHFEFLGLTDKPHGRLLRTRATVEVAGGLKPACVADLLTLIILDNEGPDRP